MDKVREDFEVWIQSERPKLFLEYLETYKPKQYADPATERLWQAWQASRKAIMIEALPDLNPLMFNDDVMFGYHKGKDEVIGSIRSAGIPVKQ